MSAELEDLLHEAHKKLLAGAPKQALKRLDRARSLAPDDPDVLALRGKALVDLERFDEAREDLERAASADPPSAVALVELGWLELGSIETDDEETPRDLARRALEAARAIDPPELDVLADAHALVLETIFESPNPQRGALEAAEEAAKDLGWSDPVALLGKGRALFYNARWEEALAPLRMASEREKKNAVACYYRGAALERLERLAEADEQLALAARLDPERYVVPFRLSDEAFDAAVEEAIASLPEPLGKVLEEDCVISRESFPAEEDVANEGVDPLMLGAFLGPSHSERHPAEAAPANPEIGRASCRER